MTVSMLDASNPGTLDASQLWKSGYRAVAGYIGGDTPHVWTREDWGKFNGWYKLPIWTASNPPDNSAAGTTAAFEAVMALHAISNGIRQVRGTPIALDLETAEARTFTAAFGSVLGWLGFPLWVYGSNSTVYSNAADGYWTANWTRVAHLDTGAIATQWTSGTDYDTSLVSTAGVAALRVW